MPAPRRTTHTRPPAVTNRPLTTLRKHPSLGPGCVAVGYPCYSKFVRRHRALKFGSEMRTPAMQAGLTPKRLTFDEIFMWMATVILFVLMLVDSDQRHDGIDSVKVAA